MNEYSRIFELFYRIIYSDRLITFNTQDKKLHPLVGGVFSH
ncbi:MULTISPECIES: hypothetical protein [unclassified Nostoc]|nr:hypothetical protein [Nostoc sp. NMS7]